MAEQLYLDISVLHGKLYRNMYDKIKKDYIFGPLCCISLMKGDVPFGSCLRPTMYIKSSM